LQEWSDVAASPADASFWPVLSAFSLDGSFVWARALRG
jgi:hypothetical protein